MVIYEAFVEGKLAAPKHLARTVHDLDFAPKYDEFRSRTIWTEKSAPERAFFVRWGILEAPSFSIGAFRFCTHLTQISLSFAELRKNKKDGLRIVRWQAEVHWVSPQFS